MFIEVVKFREHRADARRDVCVDYTPANFPLASKLIFKRTCAGEWWGDREGITFILNS